MSGRLVDTLVLLMAAGMALPTLADEWPPIEKREVFSAHRRHVLVIEPDAAEEPRPGHCLATLFKQEDGKRTQVWSRCLINDDGPVRAFVADSGDYVLTMDEWGQVGTLPVVIYGPRGDLIRVHNLDSLGLEDDILKIRQTLSSSWWNEDSISFFGADEERFFIRLHWGKWIVLELARGDVFKRLKKADFLRDDLYQEHKKKWNELKEYRQRELEAQAIARLASESARERAAGALVCGQEKFAKAVPGLKALLKDEEHYRTNQPKEWTRVYPVRKAAKEALEAMGERVEGVVVEEPDK